MVECLGDWYTSKYFGYKRSNRGKKYIGHFSVKELHDRYEIWGLSIQGAYRNKGYGTRMLKEFLSQFKSDKPLVLYVYKTNEPAIKLYQKVGFTITGDCYFTSDAYKMEVKTNVEV